MELLIIFIIIMILSSIMRSFKGAAREDKPAVPTYDPVELLQDEEKQDKAETVYATDEEEESPFAWLEGPRAREEFRRGAEELGETKSEQPFASYNVEEKQSPAKITARNKKRKRAEQGAQLSPKIPQKDNTLQQSWGQEQRHSHKKVFAQGRSSYLQEGELEVLITGKRLPLGIVASEVLSAPRSKKPYRSLRRG